MVEMLAAKSAVPINGHFKERPARKNPTIYFYFLLNPEKTPMPTMRSI
jgi:hypothetical protein